METQINSSTNSGQTGSKAKDFFINLGAIVALYTLVYSLIDLLFTVINKAYPKIINGYDYGYFGSTSISWPVATLVIFFPIFILLMWLLEKEYKINPEKQDVGIHRWLTYITLFVAGITIAGDLITVLYYFIDGQELTTGFLLKVLVLLVIAAIVFSYYLSDVLGKLTARSRNIYRLVALIVVIASVVWGFAVLGSPRTQRLYKYDQQKISDLQNINSQIMNFYSNKGLLPKTTIEETYEGNYHTPIVDTQSQKPYEYKKITDTTYELCAEFNKASDDKMSQTSPYVDLYDGTATSWAHPAGRYCFTETINPNTYYNYNQNLNSYPKPLPVQ